MTAVLGLGFPSQSARNDSPSGSVWGPDELMQLKDWETSPWQAVSSQ